MYLGSLEESEEELRLNMLEIKTKTKNMLKICMHVKNSEQIKYT